MRCLHEADSHEENCFLTLTYKPEALPKDMSLHVEDFQLFMKRLRKRFALKKIRFFHCGEYGEITQRPHYHACIFGFDFPDKVLWRVRDGIRLYTSEELSKLWPAGFSTIGDVTFDSAAYVARYIMKKVTGDQANEYYDGRKPEYITMSRRPGIGKAWYEKYKNEVYPEDEVVVNGVKMKPPKFYDGLYECDDPLAFKAMKNKRKLSGIRHQMDNDSFRLPVKEFVKKSRIKNLVRNLGE